jgi:hypothetical protein
MIETICRELNHLLDITEEMLVYTEPSLTDWEDYNQKRNKVFSCLQSLMPLKDPSHSALAKLQMLIAKTIEKDALLSQKIQGHLSNFRQAMAAAKKQKRVFKAYAAIAVHSSIRRCSV